MTTQEYKEFREKTLDNLAQATTMWHQTMQDETKSVEQAEVMRKIVFTLATVLQALK